MKKNMKRIVTLVLCAVMALGLLAVSASADGLTENDNVVTAKSVTANTDGTYTVSLSAYATGAETIETEKVYQPLDIVIAMDVSEKMNTYMTVADKDDSNTMKNLDKEYGATENVYQLYDPVEDNKPWRRMKYEDKWLYRSWSAIGGIHDRPSTFPLYLPEWLEVGSAQNYSNGTGIRIRKIDAEKIAVQNFLKDLKIKAGNAGDVPYNVSVVQYAGSTQGVSGSAQVGTSNFVCGWTTNYDNVKDIVVQQDAFATDKGKDEWDNAPTYQTSGDDHLDQALIQAQNAFSDRSGAKKILILFSSGESANGDAAKTIATAMGDVTIYTVAIGATNSGALSEIANGGAYSSVFANDLQNRLDQIFAQIDKTTTTGGSNIALDASTVLQDVVTEYFDIVPDSASAYSMSSSESGTWTRNSDSYPVSVSGRTVTATGFSYKDNWVGTTNGNHHAGKKLVVEFKIKPRDGFLGGNGVPTNVLADSGVYSGQTLIENFLDPGTQDVPLADLTVTAQDKNVYLTTIPTADQMKEGAEVKFGTTTLNLSAENYGLAAWQTAYISSISLTRAAVSTGFDGTADGTYTLTGTITSGTASKTFSASAKINVFKPVLTYSDVTIYLGATPTLKPTSTVWKHGDTFAYAVTMLGTAPTLSDFSYSTSDFSTCQKDVTLTGLKVGGTTVTSGFTANAFNVHVLKPTLTASDVTIYRGNSVSLNGQVSISAWACSCTGSAQKTGTVADGPTPSYSFDDGAAVTTPAAYSPADCKTVTASWTLGGQTFSSNQFHVHVLQPDFTVNTNDVWADYGVAVDLAANCVDYTAAWSDKNHTGVTEDGVSGKPGVETSSTAFTYGAVTGLTNGVYTVGESDQIINVTGLNYKFSNGLTGSVEYTDVSFTVHVNTFDLTIKKSWSGADCYKQDTIFIITRKNNGSFTGEALRVVIPKDKGSVTIAGLLCGQQYQVKEDTGWSWRWEPESASHVVSGRGAPAHNHQKIYTAAPAECHAEAGFTNTLNSSKTQWLSGSDYVNNVYNNGWSQVTANIVNKARQALHLG